MYFHIYSTDAIIYISLEQIKYSVNINDRQLSVPVTASAVAPQDIIVEVTITDVTAIGKHLHVCIIT